MTWASRIQIKLLERDRAQLRQALEAIRTLAMHDRPDDAVIEIARRTAKSLERSTSTDVELAAID